ncbi:MAG: 2Fe-2S iron-sulfur cluster-binding protein [Rhodospirillales bacterium]|jgi:ferredoxin
MPLVTIINHDNITFDVKQDRSILAGAREAKLPWRSYCGGKALCGTCCVLVVDGVLEKPTDIERYFIEGWGYHSSFRLACQARVVEPVSLISCADAGFEQGAVLAVYAEASSATQGNE